ncbi:MAG TPA: NADH-quinone oxidoreductase subunit N [Actinomycetota bacterium]|nr:NADH-quinone oxidoreductase subunit N [Actinomycetota bacterium]
MPGPGVETPQLALTPILPEIVLVSVGILILLWDAVRPIRSAPTLGLLAAAGIVGAAIPLIAQWGDPDAHGLTVLGDMVASDGYALFFRAVILASALIAVLLSTPYVARSGEVRGEYHALLLFCTSGMTLLAAAADLIVVFLALEVLSLSLYVMVGFVRARLESQEASLKYFLLGAFSSAFFLYGIALAYGATGTTSLAGIADELAGARDLALPLAAAGLLAVGFAFKVAAVPFHMWTPDVYQGAPTPVTGFMAAGTKVAGFAALIRVTSIALGPLSWEILPALYVLAALTMVIGSLLAIAQDDVKRLLAYSSIAHAGFVLVGVAAANQEGIAGAMFYLVAYVAMILGAFGVVLLVSRFTEERTSLRSYRGLGRRNPLAAALLALFLLSLAGLPPTAGFMAKWVVFLAAVDAGLTSLVVIAVLASVVAAFFYIRVIWLMYMEDVEEAERVPASPGPAWGLAAAAAVTVILGVVPSLLLDPLRSVAVLRW